MTDAKNRVGETDPTEEQKHLADIKALRRGLARFAAVFRAYAEHHSNKGDHDKAKRNIDHAQYAGALIDATAHYDDAKATEGGKQ